MDELLKLVEDSSTKLILIVGRPGSGKSKVINAYSDSTGIPIIDLSKIIAADTENLKKTMKAFLASYRFDTLLLDNKRPMYNVSDSVELMDILKDLSTDKRVITTWNGFIEDGQLSHIVGDQEDFYPVDGSFKYIIV